MVETVVTRDSGSARTPKTGTQPQSLAEIVADLSTRQSTGIAEVDRVLGGGIVPGSLTLIGGDPGIGKSTLVLQAAANAARNEAPALYVSGEESKEQIKLRANRLDILDRPVQVLAEASIERVLAAAEQMNPGLLIIDSIQTSFVEELESSAGSVAQVRECTARLMRWAKPRQTPVFVIGHVTKEGSIAGPRVLEHMVDVVLYLEGERFQQFRILRSVKNRFGSTDEIGVFEMAEKGLLGVDNASEAFLQERAANAAGSVVAVTIEGTRPILVEIQALTTSTAYGLPKRSANGLDLGRLQLLVAVLQKRAGLQLGNQDVFANAVGGLRVNEPSSDLSVALAIASSVRDKPIDSGTVAIGEIGLSGEIRSTGMIARRLNEAYRLGFTRAIVSSRQTDLPKSAGGITIVPVPTVAQAIRTIS